MCGCAYLQYLNQIPEESSNVINILWKKNALGGLHLILSHGDSTVSTYGYFVFKHYLFFNSNGHLRIEIFALLFVFLVLFPRLRISRSMGKPTFRLLKYHDFKVLKVA